MKRLTIGVVLLRAAQEAFANIRKHSAASAVTVSLSAVGSGVRMSVADNGNGLSDGHTEGFGLRGLRARATQVGGTLTVTPTPGGGIPARSFTTAPATFSTYPRLIRSAARRESRTIAGRESAIRRT